MNSNNTLNELEGVIRFVETKIMHLELNSQKMNNKLRIKRWTDNLEILENSLEKAIKIVSAQMIG